MANIQGQKKWSPIRLLETHELARGGVDGNLNEQAQALADRTELLREEKASKQEIVQGVYEFDTYAEFNAAKAILPANCTVVIGEENTTGSGQWGIGNNSWNGSILKKSSFDPAEKSKNEINNRLKIKIDYARTLNQYLNSNGVITNYGGTFYSNAIPTLGVSKILLENLKAAPATTSVLAFYDANGNFISTNSIVLSANVSTTSIVVDVPVSAATFRISGDNAASFLLYKIMNAQNLLDENAKVKATVNNQIASLDIKTSIYAKKDGVLNLAGSAVHNSTGVPANRTVVSTYALQPGLLTSIKVRVVVVGDKTLTLMLFKKNSNTSFTNKMKVNVTLPDDVVAGDVVTFQAGIDFPEFDVNEILYPGVYQPTGSARIYYGAASSGAFYSFAGDAGAVDVTQTTYVGSSQALSIEATTEKTPAQVNKELIGTESLAGYQAKSISEFGKGKTQLETISFVSGDASTPLNKLVVNATMVKQDGFVYEFDAYVKDGSGTFDILVCTGTGTAQTIVNRIPVTGVKNTIGVQKFVAGKNFEPFKVSKNQRLGVYSTTVRFAYTYTGGGTYTASSEGEPSIGSTIAVSGANSLLQMNWSFLSFPKGRQWSGKKAVLIGDSITEIYSDTWSAEVKEITGLDIVANYGVNGQVLKPMADALTTENMAGIDLVLCLGGVNDWHHGSATLGSPSDTSSANTIYGAVKNIVEKVYAANPSTLVIFATPFNTGKYTTGPEYGASNPNGLTIKNIDLAMLDACGDLGIPCFSTRQKSGVNHLNLSVMTIDNIHPSGFGGRHFGKIWGEFINQQHPLVF